MDNLLGNLDKAPEKFLTVCKIAGLEEEAEKQWLQIKANAWTRFFSWLLLLLKDKPTEMAKLEAFAESEPQKEAQTDLTSDRANSLIELIPSLLDEGELLVAKNVMTEYLLEGIEAFYLEIKKKLSVEQRQVINAFLTKNG